MDQLCQLKGEDLLRLVQRGTLKRCERFDLVKRKEGKHLQALDNIGVVDIAPVLIELEGRGLVRVEPHSALLGLAHLLALRIEKQINGHGIGVLAQLSADQLGAAEHVAPLVVAAELHIAAVLLVEHVEVVALHYHVVEFEEGKTFFHALLVALRSEHIIHREAGSDLPQKLHIVEPEYPVRVVDH